MDSQDHYAILGVPFNADAAAIRRAFRQRVKQIHPDVAADKTNANEAFIRLKEAYNVLSDPQRRTNYDVTYAGRVRRPAQAQQQQARPGQAGPGTAYGAPQPGPDTWTAHQSSLTVPELLQRAMRELATGRYRYAGRDLADVLAREPENPDAMLLMGRLYRSEGRNDEWIRILEDGIRKVPTNAALRLALNDAMRFRNEQTAVRMSPEMLRESRQRAYAGIGLMGSGALMLYGTFHAGPPLALVTFLIGEVPAALLLCFLATALLGGWTMASTGYITPIDDELFFPDTHGRSMKRKTSRNDAPLGLAVPLMALIHYTLAVGVIVVLMLTRGVFSRSLSLVSALALALAVLMGLAFPQSFRDILMWCPGWMLFAEFCGWYIGEFFRQ